MNICEALLIQKSGQWLLEGLNFNMDFKLNHIKTYSRYSILNYIFKGLTQIHHGS